MSRLSGKRALITGGTTGIGLATAREFLREGARVIATGSNPKTLAAAAGELSGAAVVASDAASLPAQKELAATVREQFGQLDILVINAGVVDIRPLEQWDEAGFDRSFGINLKGPFFLVQSLLPVFAAPASIVLTTSINAHIGMPNSSVYAATKAALLSLARTLSGELIGRGIRVNAISPGPIQTPAHQKFNLPAAQVEAFAESLKAQIPAGRFGTSEEIARTIVFFASDEAQFTVGSELIIDGGMSTLR